mmetsp:Transcript_37886/g.108222  ORF Transcript_37886/g.108222 Transcript_37886/m.108222 type:complete len:431 (+) Transcript_37886:319-1611(+)
MSRARRPQRRRASVRGCARWRPMSRTPKTSSKCSESTDVVSIHTPATSRASHCPTSSMSSSSSTPASSTRTSASPPSGSPRPSCPSPSTFACTAASVSTPSAPTRTGQPAPTSRLPRAPSSATSPTSVAARSTRAVTRRRRWTEGRGRRTVVSIRRGRLQMLETRRRRVVARRRGRQRTARRVWSRPCSSPSTIGNDSRTCVLKIPLRPIASSPATDRGRSAWRLSSVVPSCCSPPASPSAALPRSSTRPSTPIAVAHPVVQMRPSRTIPPHRTCCCRRPRLLCSHSPPRPRRPHARKRTRTRRKTRTRSPRRSSRSRPRRPLRLPALLPAASRAARRTRACRRARPRPQRGSSHSLLSSLLPSLPPLPSPLPLHPCHIRLVVCSVLRPRPRPLAEWRAAAFFLPAWVMACPLSRSKATLPRPSSAPHPR